MVAAHDAVELVLALPIYYELHRSCHDVVEAVVAVQDELKAAHDTVELVSAHDAVDHVLAAVGHVLVDL